MNNVYCFVLSRPHPVCVCLFLRASACVYVWWASHLAIPALTEPSPLQSRCWLWRGSCVWQGHCWCITVHWFKMIHAGWGRLGLNTDWRGRAGKQVLIFVFSFGLVCFSNHVHRLLLENHTCVFLLLQSEDAQNNLKNAYSSYSRKHYLPLKALDSLQREANGTWAKHSEMNSIETGILQWSIAFILKALE